MCNVPADIMTKLAETVEQFLREGRMFTGYDVTIETRIREKIMLRHSDVREAVHEMECLKDAMDFGVDHNGQTVRWNRTQRTMPQGGWAWVFHPTNIDPAGYVPRTQAAGTQVQAQHALNQQTNPGAMATLPPPTPSISLAQDGTTSDSGGEQDDGSFGTDYRGRLLIPTRFFRDCNITPNDKVAVISDQQRKCIFIMAEQMGQQQSGTITVQTVEHNGDIRLSSKSLGAAHFNGSKFKIEQAERPISGSNKKVIEISEISVASN